MGATILAWIMKGGWKHILGAGVVGVLIVGIAFLYAGWQINGALAEKYKTQVETRELIAETLKGQLLECKVANDAWVLQGEEWTARTQELKAQSELFRNALARERAARRVANRRIEELTAEMDAAITATDCEGALDQLLAALDWVGAP